MVSPVKLIIPIVAVAIVVVAILLILTPRYGGGEVTQTNQPQTTPTLTTPTEGGTTTTRTRSAGLSVTKCNYLILNIDAKILRLNFTATALNVSLTGEVSVKITYGKDSIIREKIRLEEYVNKTFIGESKIYIAFQIEVNDRETEILRNAYLARAKIPVEVTIYYKDLVSGEIKSHSSTHYSPVSIETETGTETEVITETPPARTRTEPIYEPR